MRRGAAPILFGLILLGACSDKDEVIRPPQDEDGDGYTDDDDCDDADAAISPAAIELCDGVDNNCDGVTDDDAEDASTWYPDNDADGYGSDRVPGQVSCEDPSSGGTAYSTDPSDCDDGDAEVSPSVEETCGDDVDNDCDDVVDNCAGHSTVGLESAHARLRGAMGEGMGSSVAGPGDVDGDGLADLIAGAPQATVSGDVLGAVYLVLGGSSGELDSSGAAAHLQGAVDGDGTGTAVSGGDVDNDGYADLLIGAPGYDSDATNSGAAWLVLGPVAGDHDLSERADALLAGTDASDACGTSLVVTGSVGGDDGMDLWVGEPNYADGKGRAYLVLGPPEGESEIRTHDGRIQGTEEGDKIGSAVGDAGDIDGDGKSDLIVGAPGAGGAGTRSGRVYLVLDELRGAIGAADADALLDGEAEGDQAGAAVSGAGDQDGDGYAEILVGAQGDDDNGADAGAVYVVSGASRGSASLGATTTKLLGREAGSYAGYSVALAGDVNADGAPDVLVGAPYDGAGGEAAGAAFVVYGPVSGVLDLADAQVEILGEESTDQAGRAVAGGGDADGDGYGDLLIASPLDDDGGSDAGAAWLVLGSQL